MDKQKHRRERRRGRRRPASTPDQKRQAIRMAALGTAALAVMLLVFNPWWHPGGSQSPSSQDTASSRSASDADRSSDGADKTGSEGSRDGLQARAQTMFTGDAPSIAGEVRGLLNAPEDSNVDSLSNLLYRHGRQDLAEASDVYDAIGREDDIATIRALAREWWPQAMLAAIEARRADLSSGLDGAKRAADAIGGLDADGLPQDCSNVSGAWERAKTLVDAASDDYDALTWAQQDLTSSMSGCAAELNDTDRTGVFGQPQGSTRTGREE